MSFWSRVTDAFTDFFFGNDDEPEYREESREERELGDSLDQEIPDYDPRDPLDEQDIHDANLEEASDLYFPDDLTEEQFEAALELIDEMLEDGWEWDDIMDLMYEDFWDWFGEFYSEM